MNVKQAAERTGYTQEYIRVLIRKKKLKAVLKKGWQISEEAIQEFEEGRSNK